MMMSAVSVGIQSVVLLLSSCCCFGFIVKHKINGEGEFLSRYKVLTYLGGKTGSLKDFLAGGTRLEFPFEKEL